MQPSPLWAPSFAFWLFIVRGGIMYLFVLFLLRLSGKRQIGQMSAGEFVAILLISNAVQNAMNGGDNSITGGLILSSTIIGLSVAIDYLMYKSELFARVVQSPPTLLVHGGQIIEQNLKKEHLSRDELLSMLRQQGYENASEIGDAVLESDGRLSVTKKGDTGENGNPDNAGPSSQGG